MQTFAAPPPGEFDQAAVCWEAGEAQFGGKGRVPTRVTVIPAGREPDFVAGGTSSSVLKLNTHAAPVWG